MALNLFDELPYILASLCVLERERKVEAGGGICPDNEGVWDELVSGSKLSRQQRDANNVEAPPPSPRCDAPC